MYTMIELTAVIAGACYGILLARRHQMDFVGVFTLALAVSFGGGTLRDLFLDRHPLFWIHHDHYPIIVFALSLVTSAIRKLPHVLERSLSIPDAIGLGFFSIAGTNAAIESETSLFIAALLGVITGTFGGVIGDIVCNRVPDLFRTAPLNATCSFTGIWLLFGLNSLGLPDTWSAPIAIGFIVCFRLLSIHFNWVLPHIGEPDVINTPSE